MRWITPRRRLGNASAWRKLKSRFRVGLLFVPVDFEGDDWGEARRRAGLSRTRPRFSRGSGYVPYLTEEAIGRTLDFMSSIQNSEVVFDYMEPPEAFSEELRQIEKARAEQLEKMGERSDSRFEPADMAAILGSHGFCDLEDIDFQEIVSRFGSAVQGLAPRHAGLHVVHGSVLSQKSSASNLEMQKADSSLTTPELKDVRGPVCSE